jgi:hypothetical protein
VCSRMCRGRADGRSGRASRNTGAGGRSPD